jgi:hypothetical protein
MAYYLSIELEYYQLQYPAATALMQAWVIKTERLFYLDSQLL